MLRKTGIILYRYFSRLLGIHPSVGKLIRGSLQLSNPDSAHFPAENLPMASRVIATGMWNYVFFQYYRQFAGPYWVERQYDPGDPSFIPRSSSLLSINLTHRTWMAFRSTRSDCFSLVDPAGSLSPVVGYYSLEFAIRYRDRVYLSTRREPSIHQSLLEETPIPVTEYEYPFGRMRVSAAGSEEDQDRIHILVEYEMDEPESTEIILGIRPFNTEGAALIHEMKLIPADHGSEVIINGKSEIRLHHPPDQSGFASLEEGDAYFVEGHADQVHCPHGIATGRIVYKPTASGGFALSAKTYEWDGSLPDLPPTRVPARSYSSSRWNVRSLMEHYRSQIRPLRHIRNKNTPVEPWKTDKRDLGEIEKRIGQAADSWKSIQSEGAAFRSAKGKWNELARVMTTYLISLQTGDTITPGAYTYRQFWYRDAAYLLHALTRWNHGPRARRVLERYNGLQERDGFFKSHAGEWDSNGQAIWSLVQFALDTGDTELLRSSYPAIRKGVKWILRMKRKGYQGKLLPTGFSAEHLGPADFYYWDNFWSLAGIEMAARAAQLLGHLDEEQAYRRELERYKQDLLEVSAPDRETFRLITAGPGRTADPGMIGSVVLLYPLEMDLFPPEELENTVNTIYKLYFQKGLFFHPIIHSGYNIYLSLQVAQSFFRLGNVRMARKIFKKAIEARSPLWTYPEAIHPGTGGGVMGDGFHGWAFSEMLLLLREFVLHQRGEEMLVLGGLRGAELFSSDLLFGPFPHRGETITIQGQLDQNGGRLQIRCSDTRKTGIRSWRIHLPGLLRKRAIIRDTETGMELERDGKGNPVLREIKNIYELSVEIPSDLEIPGNRSGTEAVF